MMWKKKRRGPNPLGVMFAVAGAGLLMLLAKAVLPDLFRYGRIHRM